MMEPKPTTAGDPVTTSPWLANVRNGVVEVSLMLPARSAEALVRISRSRGQSIAQVMRSIIDDALRCEA